MNIINKINKTIVHDDGSVDGFDKQIVKLLTGVYDTTYPMVISSDSSCLSYIDSVNKKAPLLINVSTILKVKAKHNVGYEFVSDCENLLEQSVLAFESLTQPGSVVVVLDEFDLYTGNPLIAVCRCNKDMGLSSICINEITSIYAKKHFLNFLMRSYEKGKTFYKNKKTERYFTPFKLQLPEDIRYALSDKYSNITFDKNQVQNVNKYNSLDDIIYSCERLSKKSDLRKDKENRIDKDVER